MRIDSDIMPVIAHGSDRAPITGNGPLARRYNMPNHGLIVTNGKGSTFALVERTRAAMDAAYFELEDRPHIGRYTPVERAIEIG